MSDIESFIRNPWGSNSKGVYSKTEAIYSLKRMMGLKKYFPNDLIPKAKEVYRGTKVSVKTYEVARDKTLTDKSRWIKLSHSYQPKSSIQSWTTQRKIALRFAENLPPDDFIDALGPPILPALISTKVDNNFIMNSKLMNLISLYAIGKKEFEVIRVNAKPIKVTINVHRDWITKYLDEDTLLTNYNRLYRN